MTAPKAFPARIHVLLAREVPVALVIRKGPAKTVATILWNRKTDEFTLGQWMRGRIYERRCDLSPDGKHLIYFALNGRWNSEAKGAYTAISKAPYLKAIALMPKGNTWEGGGLFLDNRRYWLNEGLLPHETLVCSSAVQREAKFTPELYPNRKNPDIYFSRLLRDGWSWDGRSRLVFKKTLIKGWFLRKFVYGGYNIPGRSLCWDHHELENAELSLRLKFPKWEWADWGDNRVVWATQGQLWAARLKPAGPYNERMLHDFNAMKFEAIAAPY